MGVHERIEPTYDRYVVLFDFQEEEAVSGSAPGTDNAYGVNCHYGPPLVSPGSRLTVRSPIRC